MGRIQSNIGLTTGLDIRNTVEQLLAVSAQPRVRLQTRVRAIQAQQVAITELTALTIGIQLTTDRLGSSANLKTTTATSSKADVITASASGSISAGSYSIQTIQTAQTSTASSSPFTSAGDTLQAGEIVVRTGGFVDSSASLDDLRGGNGISRGKILVTDRAGSKREVDLRFATNIDDVAKAINNTSGLRVSAKTEGDRIVLSDLSGQTVSNLIVEEVAEGRTAVELGLSGINVAANTATGEDINFLGNNTRLSTLRDNRGIAFELGTDLKIKLRDGTQLDIDANETKTPASVGQLLTAINAANPSKIEARIKADGTGFELIDKTTGTESFEATGKLSDQLGLTGVSGSTGTISGGRIQGTLQGPLLSTLRGGQGIGTPGSISITNRAGIVKSIDLSGSISLRNVIDKINASGGGITASLNKSRTGLVLQDVTGSSASNFIIADDDTNTTATKLGLVASTDQNSIDSKSLGSQYISEATSLKKLNQGRGVRLGSFTITNSAGLQKTVNLAIAGPKTVGEVLKAINSNDIRVEATLNSDGDGIVLIDRSGGASSLTIADTQGGNTALDLGIRGTGIRQSAPARQEINGSQTFRLTLTGTETLTQVAEKLNESNGPLTASLLTSGPSTVRLLFTSRATGEVGRIAAEGDSVGININSSASARDAVISVGAAGDSGGTIVRSSSNTFDSAITGLTLNVKGSSPDPVEISVASNNSNIEKNLQLFVDQYNRVRDKIAKETEFDQDAKTTGRLFGSTEVLRVEQNLTRFVSQRTFGTGRIQSLEQLGVSLDDKGKLNFNKDKFAKALESHPEDVQAYLTKEKTGLGVRAKTVLDGLVGVDNSVLVNRTKSLQRTIESNNSRIETLNARLDRERERLSKQFFDLENNLAKIRNNGLALNQLNTTQIR